MWSLRSTKHFWSFTAKQHCNILLNNCSRWGHNMAQFKFPRAPRSQIDWKKCSFTKSSLQLLACAPSEVGAQGWPRVQGVNTVFSNPLKELVASKTQIMLDELCGVISVGVVLKEAPASVVQDSAAMPFFLWGSRNYLWTTKLCATFRQREGE